MSELTQEIQQGFDRYAVRDRVLDLASTCEPEDPYDPADVPKPSAALLALADLLGNVRASAAAEGIQAALWDLYARWTIGN